MYVNIKNHIYYSSIIYFRGEKNNNYVFYIINFFFGGRGEISLFTLLTIYQGETFVNKHVALLQKLIFRTI